MSKKSFLHNIWNIIIGGNETPNQRHISVSQADNLQKKYLLCRLPRLFSGKIFSIVVK